jgi:enamine deaminase RidA (YjgF/YER057c/UK114 family)
VIEEKLTSMGIELPRAASPLGAYVPVVILGHAAYISGQIPLDYTFMPAQLKFKGKVGREVSIDDARTAASICVVNALGHLKLELGRLENIKRIVKVTGYINCESTFTKHPEVMNGASDLILNLFGDIGRHTRVSVGTNSLPLDSPMEVDMIVEI